MLTGNKTVEAQTYRDFWYLRLAEVHQVNLLNL